MRIICGVASVFALMGVLSSTNAGEKAPETGQHARKFEKDGAKLDYLLYLPPKYNEDAEAKWPLIIFLHGSGERGSDVNMVKKHGPPKIVEGKDSPLAGRFVVVSPQCPEKSQWNSEGDNLNKLLDDVLKTCRIDEDRVYLTGLSMGGFGTWGWAAKSPQRFAAVSPMCGGGDPAQAEKLKSLPIWVFHGEVDDRVPIRLSEAMVNAVKNAGNVELKFTRYPDAGHDCWTRSYANPELYTWLLAHHRGEKPGQ